MHVCVKWDTALPSLPWCLRPPRQPGTWALRLTPTPSSPGCCGQRSLKQKLLVISQLFSRLSSSERFLQPCLCPALPCRAIPLFGGLSGVPSSQDTWRAVACMQLVALVGLRARVLRPVLLSPLCCPRLPHLSSTGSLAPRHLGVSTSEGPVLLYDPKVLKASAFTCGPGMGPRVPREQ